VLERLAGPQAQSALVLPVIEELAASLRIAGIPDPRRAAVDILASLLDVQRSWPIMNLDAALESDLVARARRAARLLAAGAPFAYAVGCSQFRHLNLLVDQRVLIPRPETEVLVDLILDSMRARRGGSSSWGVALDIGTGSGAIAISLATEGRFDRVIATDMSADAIDVAKENARSLAHTTTAPVEFRNGSFLDPVKDINAELVVSNPPYVSFAEIDLLPASVRDWEPPVALLSANDGMAATAAIVQDGARALVSGGLLALEVDVRRASLIAELVMSDTSYADVRVGLDHTGRERFVFASRV